MAKFPLYLSFQDRTYAICGYLGEVEEYLDNKGYIDKTDKRIYICTKNDPPYHNDVPIVKIETVDGKDRIQSTKRTANDITDKIFREDNLYDLSMSTIIENTHEDDVLYNPDELADINAASTTFRPTINDDDDPLKKIIKMAINEKDIDISRLKHKLPEKYGLSNLKSALVQKTKMSILYFTMWCNLLSLDFTVMVEDNGTDTISPLRKPLFYKSNEGKVSY